jgi:hypothetical protein
MGKVNRKGKEKWKKKTLSVLSRVSRKMEIGGQREVRGQVADGAGKSKHISNNAAFLTQS